MNQQKDKMNLSETNRQAQQNDVHGVPIVERERNDLIVRKSEKLTTALYMVSDIIPDREPVKWKMRETAIELLSDITLSGTASVADRISYLRNVVKRIEKIVSFLEIAWATRILSEMNAAILRDEYFSLRTMIEDDISTLLVGNVGRSVPVPPTYRMTREMPDRVTQTARAPERTVQGAARSSSLPPAKSPHSVVEGEKKTIEFSFPQPNPRSPSVPSSPTLAQSNTSMSERKHKEELKQKRGNGEKMGREDRRKIILALLKQRSNLTVRDIAKSIPGFSEKTIQRELVSMLGEGVVSKAGEKRWTTYSLA